MTKAKKQKMSNKKDSKRNINSAIPKCPKPTKTTTSHNENVAEKNENTTTNTTVTSKTSPTKLNRNQVSANWSTVVGSLKSQRHVPPQKKIGKCKMLIKLIFNKSFV